MISKKDFERFLDGYKLFHSEDWCGLHDCHDTSRVEQIQNTGLIISSNFNSKNGGRFRTTMYVLSDNNSLMVPPVAPMIIRIPKELAELSGASSSLVNLHENFAGWAEETRLADGDSRDRTVTPLRSSEGANIRLLPKFLVDGHFDMQTGQYVENPSAYKNLAKEQQQRIKDAIVNNRADSLCDETTYKSQPKIEKISQEELQSAKTEIMPQQEVEIDYSYRKEEDNSLQREIEERTLKK